MDFTFVNYEIVECVEDHTDVWPEIVMHWRVKANGKNIAGITIDRHGVVSAGKIGHAYRPIGDAA